MTAKLIKILLNMLLQSQGVKIAIRGFWLQLKKVEIGNPKFQGRV